MKKILHSVLLVGTFTTFIENSAIARNEIINSSVSGRADAIDFIENKGQWKDEGKYRAAVPGGVMFITDKGFVYDFLHEEDFLLHTQHLCSEAVNHHTHEQTLVRKHAYQVNFVNSNPTPRYAPTDRRSYYHNYFIGNDRSVWQGNVGLYGAVTQKNVYDGIDMQVYSHNSQQVKYDFIVAPGANPNIIQLSFEGVYPVLTEDGHLKIKTSVNEIIERAPYTYQVIEGNKTTVASSYKLQNGILSFSFPEGYNEHYPLVIDPDLVFGTFSGGQGTGAYYAHSTTYDNLGNTYTAALVTSNTGDWPTTIGAYQEALPSSNSVAINKYNIDGSALLYSTYFGGNDVGSVQPHTLRVTDDYELVLAGYASDATTPVTTNAYQTTMNGGSDIYVVRFNEDGTDIVASTFVGGSGFEASRIGQVGANESLGPSGGTAINPVDVAFDPSGNVWVTSNSNSMDFPMAGSSFQNTLAGQYDVVIFKLSQDFSTLMYSTYVGGDGWDGGIAIEYNRNNNTVGVVGSTNGTDFPVTAGVYHATKPGGQDGFALLIDNNTYNLAASTYIGTSADDFAMRLAFDCKNNFFIAGCTGGNYPITATQGHVPTGLVFIDKLDANLSSSIASTRTGGSSSIVPSAMMVDICGNILIATIGGSTNSQPGMPLTPDAFDTLARSFYFAAFEPNFASLVFGSYFGGPSGDHYHPGMSRIDPNGIIYHSVCASGAPTTINWPTSAWAWSPEKMNGSTNDNITFKFNFDAVVISVDRESYLGANEENAHAIRGCKSAYLHYTRNVTPEPVTISLIVEGTALRDEDYQLISSYSGAMPAGINELIVPANDSTVTIEVKPLLAPTTTGPRYVVIHTIPPCDCDGGGPSLDNVVSSDTIWIYDSLYVGIISPADTSCPGEERMITADIDKTLDYVWGPQEGILSENELTIYVNPQVTQTYYITVSQPGAPGTCPSRTMYYEATVEPYPIISVPDRNIVACADDSIDVVIYVQPEGFAFKAEWTPNDYFGDPTLLRPKFKAPAGTYPKRVRVYSPGANCSAEDSLMITVGIPLTFDWVSPLDTTIKYGESVQLSSQSEAVTWNWYPLTYLNQGSVKDPISTPKKSIEYTLVGMNAYGCTDTATIFIHVTHETNIGVPSGFSPNGDGVNDVFKLQNIAFETLQEFKVFNKYGELVFETHDINKGWDGTHKGKPAALDTYVYIIRVTLTDGTPVLFKGDVTLLR